MYVIDFKVQKAVKWTAFESCPALGLICMLSGIENWIANDGGRPNTGCSVILFPEVRFSKVPKVDVTSHAAIRQPLVPLH